MFIYIPTVLDEILQFDDYYLTLVIRLLYTSCGLVNTIAYMYIRNSTYDDKHQQSMAEELKVNLRGKDSKAAHDELGEQNDQSMLEAALRDH